MPDLTEFERAIELHDAIKDYKTRYTAPILKTFRDTKENKFNKYPKPTERRVNLSSTVICTYTLVQYSNLWIDNNLKVIGEDFQQIEDYWDFIIKVLAGNAKILPIEMPDEFTVLNTLPLLRKIRNAIDKPTKEDDKIILNIIEALCEQFFQNRFEWSENPHPFVYYKFLLLLDDWEDLLKAKFSPSAIENLVKNKKEETFVESVERNGIQNVMSTFRQQIYNKGKHELYRQMTLHTANDRTLFDVKRLIYSLLIVSRRTKYSNSTVFKKALDTIFQEQLKETGLFPICHVVNNDFVLEKSQIIPRQVSANPLLNSFECYNDMLSDDNMREELKRYQEKLNLAADWAKRQLRRNPDNRSEFFGWIPEYESTHEAEASVTSHILLFFKYYCELLSKQTKEVALKHLAAKDITLSAFQPCDTYNIIEHIESLAKPDSNYYSALLFGPPGTGKTTIAKYLASRLNWKYVEISPASYLHEGPEKVVAEAADIFKHLSRINEAVVLFDEVDELLKLRQKDHPDRPAWTITALLPLLADLRDRKKIKFLLATNHLPSIDKAAYRVGRIDLVLPMGCIGWRCRMQMLQKTLLQTTKDIRENVSPLLPILNEKELKSLDRNALPTSYLQNYAERTNFINRRDLMGVLRTVFDKQTYKQVQREKLFSVFFGNSKSNKWTNYIEPDLQDFHSKLVKTNLLELVRLPDERRAMKRQIIEDNIILPSTNSS